VELEVNGAFFRSALDEKTLLKVGEFNISWGELDFTILLLLQELLGLEWFDLEDKFGGEQTRVRMNALLDVFSQYKTSFSHDIEIPQNLKKRFNRLSSTRNALAHGVWMLVASGEQIFSVCAHIGRANVYVSEKKLNLHSSELKILVKDLAAVWSALNNFEMSAEKPSLFLGIGNPEGAVAAPPGSVYIDLGPMGRKMPKL